YDEKDLLSLGIGVDHTTADNLYYNVQFIENYIFEYTPLHAQEKSVFHMMGSFSKDYLMGCFLVSLDWAYNFAYKDWRVNPEVRYKFANGLNTSFGGYIFEGPISATFGRFSAKDLVYLEFDFSF
ncbi:hypothetical protein KAR91_35910, partial [Candidatus Pacearchaeota archaeon]|nr:hypothetical protein [Candidatus Pacearchaeota archaeon]